MFLSVVIPAFNEAELIGQTLGQIKYALSENYSGDFQWEIIVGNNNSSDGTSAIAAKAGAKVVFEPINQISRARNCGAGLARGEYWDKLISRFAKKYIDSRIYWIPG